MPKKKYTRKSRKPTVTHKDREEIESTSNNNQLRETQKSKS
jgi:hypothetical protein